MPKISMLKTMDTFVMKQVWDPTFANTYTFAQNNNVEILG
jgi:hypothetical protein